MLERVSSASKASWVVRVPRALARLKLVCLPHAGGGASSFRPWGELLGPEIEVCAVQLPGREERIREPAISSLPDLVGALVEHTAPLRRGAYAFFGHSVGALVAFELTRELRRRGQPLPAHLFVSGAAAPQLADPEPALGASTDDELLARLRRHCGTPSAVLEHADLMELILPTLRADLALRDAYCYVSEPPLELPITAYGGLDDPDVSQSDLMAWREQTSSRFNLRAFPGGHFFVRSERAALLSAVESELSAC